MIFSLKNEGIHEGAEPMKPLMKTVFFHTFRHPLFLTLLFQKCIIYFISA